MTGIIQSIVPFW